MPVPTGARLRLNKRHSLRCMGLIFTRAVGRRERVRTGSPSGAPVENNWSNILLAIWPGCRLCAPARSSRAVAVGQLPDAIVTLTNILDEPSGDTVGVFSPGSVFEQKRAQLIAQLAAIDTMDLTALRQLWSEHFGTPPTLRSIDLMRLTVSWRLQARVHGGLDAGIRRRLRRPTKSDPQSAIDLPVGTRLKREWQGLSYVIEVSGEGFCWNGATYASLSAVAKAITGTNWNGPRFFGLRKGRP